MEKVKHNVKTFNLALDRVFQPRYNMLCINTTAKIDKPEATVSEANLAKQGLAVTPLLT